MIVNRLSVLQLKRAVTQLPEHLLDRHRKEFTILNFEKNLFSKRSNLYLTQTITFNEV